MQQNLVLKQQDIYPNLVNYLLGGKLVNEDILGRAIKKPMRYIRGMSKDDFESYINKLKNAGREHRAAFLKKRYELWKKKGYSDEEAIIKAFADFYIDVANEFIKRLEDEGIFVPSDIPKNKRDEYIKKRIIEESDFDTRKKWRRLLLFRRLKGHGLSYHQAVESLPIKTEPVPEENDFNITIVLNNINNQIIEEIGAKEIPKHVKEEYSLSPHIGKIYKGLGELRGSVIIEIEEQGKRKRLPPYGRCIVYLIEKKEFFTYPNKRGNYRIENIPPGTYIVRCRVSGYKPKEESVTIRSGEVSVQNFFFTLEDRTEKAKKRAEEEEKRRAFEEVTKAPEWGPFKTKWGRPVGRAVGFTKKTVKRITDKIEDKWGRTVIDAFIILIFLSLGLVTSIYFHSYMFMGAFLCWMIVYLIPEGKLPEMERIIISVKWKDFKEWFKRGSGYEYNAGLGLVRSIFKVLTITLFIFGIRGGTLPFPNILLMITAFAGYFSLKLTYDPKIPSSVIESLVRFFVGFIVIPFWVVNYIFQTMVLTIIAIAFFAIPPIPEQKKEGETYIFMNYFIFDRILFAIFMFIALIGAGVMPVFFQKLFPGTWQLTGPLKATFLWFWLVTATAGFFSSPETRPVTGFFMLGVATIIYGLGPGTNEVIQGLLGPWGPTVYTTITNVVRPLNNVFEQLTSTFGNALQLLINPVGFAQRIMNGSYTTDPTTGLRGAYGVEMERISVTPIYPYQPFNILLTLKNKGSFPAKNVSVGVMLNPNIRIVPEKIGVHHKLFITDFGINTSDIQPEIRCERGRTEMNKPFEICYLPIGDMSKLDVRQVLFISSGVKCERIRKYGLREKFIPLLLKLKYDYQIHSSLDMEFVSEDEWDRKIKQEEFITQKKKPATFTNAPVQLNIDAPEQPIKEGIHFFIGLQLASGPRGGKIEDVKSIQLEIPNEIFKNFAGCSPSHTYETKDVNETVLVWEGWNIPKSYVIYCQFKPIHFDSLKIKGPTKTFYIQAHANYTFSKTAEYNTQIQFGGGCCSDKDCPKGQICSWKEGMNFTGVCGAEEVEVSIQPGGPDFCEYWISEGQGKCDHGMGGCKNNDECVEKIAGANLGRMVCKSVADVDVKLCCYENESDVECRKSYEFWLERIKGY